VHLVDCTIGIYRECHTENRTCCNEVMSFLKMSTFLHTRLGADDDDDDYDYDDNNLYSLLYL
jgi:hypothetical protein